MTLGEQIRALEEERLNWKARAGDPFISRGERRGYWVLIRKIDGQLQQRRAALRQQLIDSSVTSRRRMDKFWSLR
jgi:hypothetical protein